MSKLPGEVPVLNPDLQAGVHGIVDAMMEFELDDLWAQVVAVGETAKRSPLYLLQEATTALLSSEDPERHEVGMKSLFWEAKNFPDIDTADALAYDAKYDARRPTFREMAGRIFEVSVLHFRSAAQKQNFVPTAGYFDKFNAVVARIEEEGFPELYEATVTEFAPLAVVATVNYTPRNDDDSLVEQWQLDETLARCVAVLRESDPELATLAQNLVQGEVQLRAIFEQNTDQDLRAAFSVGDFDTARQLLVRHENHLVLSLWPEMVAVVSKLGPEELGWGHEVLDTLLEVRPGYFSEEEYIDMFYGTNVGITAGILGREDVVSTLIKDDGNIRECAQTMSGIAYGYGMTGNDTGFQKLIGTMELEDTILAILQESFDNGIQETARLSTDPK